MGKANFMKVMGESGVEGISASDLFGEQQERLWYSLGAATLDSSINQQVRKGAPGGHIIQLEGKSGTGKSLFGDMAILDAQRQGGYGLLFDLESSFDGRFFSRLGIDLSRLSVVEGTVKCKDGTYRPRFLEETFEAIEDAIITYQENLSPDTPAVFLVDSLGALQTRFQYGLKNVSGNTSTKDRKSRGSDTGRRAQAIKKWLWRLRGPLSKTNILLIFINHVYSTMDSFSDMETAGGEGAKYLNHLRIQTKKVRRSEKAGENGTPYPIDKGKILNERGQVVGERLHLYITKSQIGRPYTSLDVDFFFKANGDYSLDYYSSYFKWLLENNIDEEGNYSDVGHAIEQSGSWYSRGDFKIQGQKLLPFLEECPELRGRKEPEGAVSLS